MHDSMIRLKQQGYINLGLPNFFFFFVYFTFPSIHPNFFIKTIKIGFPGFHVVSLLKVKKGRSVSRLKRFSRDSSYHQADPVC